MSHLNTAYWCPLTAVVRDTTVAMSTEAIHSWELKGRWLVCQAEQCGDAEHCGRSSGRAIAGTQHQGSWYHLSVQRRRPQSHASSKGVGLRAFKGFMSVWVWECGLNGRTSFPAFNLFSRARKHVAICSCERQKTFLSVFWHGKTVPKDGSKYDYCVPRET